MKLNPILSDILSEIVADIKNGNGDFSTITNTTLSKKLNISAFTVRDKVIQLHKMGFIDKRTNVWTKDRKFYNRIIYLK